MNKTGTKTLGRALDVLGFAHHHGYSPDLTIDWSMGKFERIFEKALTCDYFEDLPWPLVYEKLFERFEDAKFILTQRASSDVWIESYRLHSERQGPKEVRKLVYGHLMPHGNEKDFISVYERHNKGVEAFFKTHAPEKLLKVCFENGDGWEVLCNFLDKPIPLLDFPWMNKKPI